MVLENDVRQFLPHVVCDLSWHTKTCWHRQRLRDRIQFGEAAVSVAWFVEQVELVVL